MRNVSVVLGISTFREHVGSAVVIECMMRVYRSVFAHSINLLEVMDHAFAFQITSYMKANA
jgi:hypothetical protein